METGQIIMIGLALIGVAVCWFGLFWASLWAVSRMEGWLSSLRATLNFEADEHAVGYKDRA